MDSFNPVPKPTKDKPKKKKQNGWKDKPNRYCYYCKTAYAERHEVFGGSNRQTSIDHGFQVDLCEKCHKEMQDNITPRAKARNLFWQQYFQRKYEQTLIGCGITPLQARETWRYLIGKNYLEPLEEEGIRSDKVGRCTLPNGYD